ncbi:cystatin-A2-like [Crassostrea virginica]
MKGLCVLVFCLTLAVVVQTQGIPGGLGPQEFAGPGEQALVQQNREAIIRKLPSYMSGPFGPLKALVFRTQVVKGTNYFIKVKMQGSRPRFLHVKIYTGLNNRSHVKDVQVKAQYDPIEFF